LVSSVRSIQELSYGRLASGSVHAVLGGFHLAPHPPEYLRQTAEALREVNPDWLIPMHCSGEPFIVIAQQVLGEKVLRSSTGTRFTFGAA
jgi:7,8-dihydropterin-6-yl-methyl-4-(beta-D-ribofuranosyl)aminobenzene 5'-phosphate synthase